MSTSPTLNGPSLPPADGAAPEQLVLLLHGVGADGNDLIGLAPYFQQVLPKALFVSPDAPFPYDMAPFGRQWFSLQERTPEAFDSGTHLAAPILNDFIDGLLVETGLTDAQTALIGFSQGTMMSLHVGPRRDQPVAGILGYSGALANPTKLVDDIQSYPPVMLIHGDSDEVLPVSSLPKAVGGLEAAGVPVTSHVRPGLGHGIDEEGIKLGVTFLESIFRS
ncbi:MAG: prolyl oligopeptidase family serine peptidase [Rhodospirillaceae bacterium]|jgi:phospholipase/carboxylesterase|nr:prolyl oligopeptidase family serine peptidase [Rhodospirillales bacterium]MBT3905320.1 prolyl oligopeptidase family serine peptidase [Rhodospirillaceae bacterium]MBT4701325.1 prolyl oligopeptidase family serine peptidase [Rhodospirillaceae bacterium]MBT5036602.1 prolyl oligopeptidase family serine peptidase [Rhodospirillaceae bacterium]MBT6219364.1 prolyl oligopeptidase family serine peptidase [Rhodospirillaceae bacterium]